MGFGLSHSLRAVLIEFLAICREQRKTLLVVSYVEQALHRADQILDMAVINRALGTSS